MSNNNENNVLNTVKRFLKNRGDFYSVAEVVYIYKSIVRKKDLFGIFDIVSITSDAKIVGIQVTTRSNVSTRRNKIKNKKEVVSRWCESGGVIEIYGVDLNQPVKNIRESIYFESGNIFLNRYKGGVLQNTSLFF